MRKSLLLIFVCIHAALAFPYLHLVKRADATIEAASGDTEPSLISHIPKRFQRKLKIPWTSADDSTIVGAVSEAQSRGRAPDWTVLSISLKRPKTTIFNRYHSCLKPQDTDLANKRQYKQLTREEYMRIIKYADSHLNISWIKIGKLLSQSVSSGYACNLDLNRNASSYGLRYSSAIDKSRKRTIGEWTVEERTEIDAFTKRARDQDIQPDWHALAVRLISARPDYYATLFATRSQNDRVPDKNTDASGEEEFEISGDDYAMLWKLLE